MGEAVEQAFALAKARQPGKAVDVLKSCLERIDPLSWQIRRPVPHACQWPWVATWRRRRLPGPLAADGAGVKPTPGGGLFM